MSSPSSVAKARIIEVLKANLKPKICQVVDNSAMHARQGHFHLLIVSNEFENMSQLKRHRKINDLVFKNVEDIHALQITAYSEAEYEKVNPERPMRLVGC